MWTKAFEIANR